MTEPSIVGDGPIRNGRVTEHQKPVKTISTSRRVTRGIVALLVIAWGAYEATLGNYVILIVIGSVLVFAGLLVGAALLRSGITMRNADFHGHLFLGFHEDDFPAVEPFENLTWVKGGAGRQGISGGHASFSAEGIKWVAGSHLTPQQRIQGEFMLPWSEIETVDVSTIPRKATFLGGALTIDLTGGRGSLAGEFLGSRQGLAKALRQSPLGGR